MHEKIIAPLLNRFDSEKIHVLAREALHLTEVSPITLKILEKALAYRGERFADSRLHVDMAGIHFENPVMLAAGWDKKGKSVAAWHTLGMAGVEVGTVLAYGQPGNEKPRQRVVGPGVALNSLGFNAPPMQEVKKNLQRYKESGIVVGVSVGKNKEIDKDAAKLIAAVIAELYDEASYFALGISSPNTPGLRSLQGKGPLTDIVQTGNAVMDLKGRRKPMLVKIDPDLELQGVNDVVEVVMDNGLAGIIASNTTINIQIKRKYGVENEAGGISGNDADFREMSNRQIRHIFRETNGQLPTIGVGGIRDAATALEKITSGASVVQLLTAVRDAQHFGPHVPGKINRELAAYLEREGIKSISELVGSSAR